MLLKNYKKITDGKKKKKITDDIEREESLSDSYIFSGSYWYSLPMHAANISIALRSNVFNTLCHQNCFAVDVLSMPTCHFSQIT